MLTLIMNDNNENNPNILPSQPIAPAEHNPEAAQQPAGEPQRSQDTVSPTPVQPLAVQPLSEQSTSPPVMQAPLESREEPKLKKRSTRLKTILILFGIIILLAGTAAGAYVLGRGDKEIVYKEREPKSLDLPPQAVVMTECVPGRGKQYILPQDIPKGPIYDVHDGKVVAIEYRIVIKDVESDPNQLSNTILGLTRDYPVDHFSMVPEIANSNNPVESFHLAMFVVPKEEANKISCPAPASS